MCGSVYRGPSLEVVLAELLTGSKAPPGAIATPASVAASSNLLVLDVPGLPEVGLLYLC